MSQTGSSLSEFLLLAGIFIPLIPATLIFLNRRQYLKEPMNFLMIICLVNAITGITNSISSINIENQHITENICLLIEFILLFRIFRLPLTGKSRNILTFLLVAFLSVCLTFYSLKGWNSNNELFRLTQYSLLSLIIFASLIALVRSTNLYILQSPLFWIAVGTLFYYVLYVLLEGVSNRRLPLSREINMEKLLFLEIASLIRYALYTLASILYHPEKLQEEEFGPL